ncbi:Metalloenzyme, LuxS/M16 peptidase-like protein, partial [Dimargaris cristalligena]
ASSSSSSASTLSLVVKGGSRYETAANSGVAHFLKHFAFKNTQSRTAFRTIRETELQGGQLTATLDRDYQIYTVRCLAADVPYFTQLLASVALETRYTDYEFLDAQPIIQAETLAAQADSEIRLFDELHRVAFHSQGLGNSLYARANNQVTQKKLIDFAQQVFQPTRLGLVGVNVDHAQLAELGHELLTERITTPASTSTLADTSASQYTGGEALFDGPAGGDAQYAMAYPSAGLDNPSGVAASRILGHLLGGSRYVKWGTGQSRLAQAAAALGHGGVQLHPFQFTYSDAGLFGIQVRAPTGADVAQAAQAAAHALQEVASQAPAAEQLQRAVNQAKAAAALAAETSAGQAAELQNLVFNGSPSTTSLQETLATLDAVSAQNIQAAAETLLKAKPTAVGVGNVALFP